MISVKATFQRIGVTALEVTSRHRIIYRGSTAGNKSPVVSTRHRNFNCKLTERQVYKTGISSGNPSSEKPVHKLNSRYLFPNISEIEMPAGEALKTTRALKKHTMHVQEGPCLHVVTNPS